jgi:hypothetical protein
MCALLVLSGRELRTLIVQTCISVWQNNTYVHAHTYSCLLLIELSYLWKRNGSHTYHFIFTIDLINLKKNIIHTQNIASDRSRSAREARKAREREKAPVSDGAAAGSGPGKSRANRGTHMYRCAGGHEEESSMRPRQVLIKALMLLRLAVLKSWRPYQQEQRESWLEEERSWCYSRWAWMHAADERE